MNITLRLTMRRSSVCDQVHSWAKQQTKAKKRKYFSTISEVQFLYLDDKSVLDWAPIWCLFTNKHPECSPLLEAETQTSREPGLATQVVLS